LKKAAAELTGAAVVRESSVFVLVVQAVTASISRTGKIYLFIRV